MRTGDLPEVVRMVSSRAQVKTGLLRRPLVKVLPGRCRSRPGGAKQTHCLAGAAGLPCGGVRLWAPGQGACRGHRSQQRWQHRVSPALGRVPDPRLENVMPLLLLNGTRWQRKRGTGTGETEARPALAGGGEEGGEDRPLLSCKKRHGQKGQAGYVHTAFLSRTPCSSALKTYPTLHCPHTACKDPLMAPAIGGLKTVMGLGATGPPERPLLDLCPLPSRPTRSLPLSSKLNLQLRNQPPTSAQGLASSPDVEGAPSASCRRWSPSPPRCGPGLQPCLPPSPPRSLPHPSPQCSDA